jgi:hypothetical protein
MDTIHWNTKAVEANNNASMLTDIHGLLDRDAIELRSLTLAAIYTTADKGHRAQKFHRDRITPGGVPGFGGRFITEMGSVKQEFLERFYSHLDHVSRERFVIDASNQCEITTQYVHENKDRLCSGTKAVSYIICLIPDEEEVRDFTQIDGTCCSFRSTCVQDQGMIFHYNPYGVKKNVQVSRHIGNNLLGRMFMNLLDIDITFLNSGNIMVAQFTINTPGGIARAL